MTLLELTSAYAPFANGGIGVLPYGISEIRDSAGKLIYRRDGVRTRAASSRPSSSA